MTGLIQLDRLPFHNAFTKDQKHIKSQQSKFACLPSEEWILLIDSYADNHNFNARDNFMRWPLTHQLGFIPANCYSQVELEDGEYSPCDLISMGIIPLTLQDIISQFAKVFSKYREQAILGQEIFHPKVPLSPNISQHLNTFFRIFRSLISTKASACVNDSNFVSLIANNTSP